MAQSVSTSSRERMLAAAEELLRERGLSGTAITEIAARGDAPIGSMYHHFPGGKTQLVAETLEIHAEKTCELLVEELSSAEPLETRVRRLFSRAAEGFARTGGLRSCAVGNVTLDVGNHEPSLRAVCAAAFDWWITAIAPLLPWEDRARRQSFAEMIVIALEGAFVRGRAEGNGEAFRTAGEWLAGAVAGE